MIPSRHRENLTEQEVLILRTLLYFDIFQYPLNEYEIERFAPSSLTGNWQASLARLCDEGLIFHIQSFYSLEEDPHRIVRRQAGNRLAIKKMKVARSISSIIARFPFVQAVLLSGSISKGYMDAASDIDYFIITAPNRLWIVRVGMAMLRRIFLFNSGRYLCTNYFIDDQHLEITEQNLFTAVETCTLRPIHGTRAIENFQRANSWVRSYLPNASFETLPDTESKKIMTGLLERLAPEGFLDRLDKKLMKKSMTHWESRYRTSLNDQDFSIAFQSSPHVSRSHPQFYQKKVLNQYKSGIQAFELRFGVSLDL